MSTKERGDDAAGHAPKPDGARSGAQAGSQPTEKQDAPNYDKRTDKDQAIAVEDMNSANDQGAA